MSELYNRERCIRGKNGYSDVASAVTKIHTPVVTVLSFSHELRARI